MINLTRSKKKITRLFTNLILVDHCQVERFDQFHLPLSEFTDPTRRILLQVLQDYLREYVHLSQVRLDGGVS